MKNDKKFILAHFNPKELEEMDGWQGGRTDADGTDIRRFHPLEEMMSKPDVEKIIVKEYEKHAKGGRVGEIMREADHMRARGRNGDSEVALIGPNTHRILNNLMGGGSVNPMTKKPEYFNLRKMMGGAGKALGRMGSMAGQALPGAMQGFMMGGPMGALAGGGASLLANQMGPGAGSDMVRNSGSMMASQMGGQNGQYQLPQNLGEAGQQFMQSPMAQNMMNSQMGQKAQGMYNQGQQMYGKAQNAYNQGQQMYGKAKGLYDKGQQFANSPQGQQMINSPMGQRVMNSQMGQKAKGMFNDAQDAYNQGSHFAGRVKNDYNTARNVGQHMYDQADQGYQNAYRQATGSGQRGGQQQYGGGPYQQAPQQQQYNPPSDDPDSE